MRGVAAGGEGPPGRLWFPLVLAVPGGGGADRWGCGRADRRALTSARRRRLHWLNVNIDAADGRQGDQVRRRGDVAVLMAVSLGGQRQTDSG